MITTLPTPPNRNSPATFADDADAFLGALPGFGVEVNEIGLSLQATSEAAAAAIASANFKGAWSGLTGALNVPAAVGHNSIAWVLLNDLADVTASEPGVSADWESLPGFVSAGITPVPALEIDCSTGTYFTKTISANSSFTFTNAPSDAAYSFVLRINHTSGTFDFPASVEWPADSMPELSAGNYHIFIFITENGGTTWRGGALTDYPA